VTRPGSPPLGDTAWHRRLTDEGKQRITGNRARSKMANLAHATG
jgi:hypothetical protein